MSEIDWPEEFREVQQTCYKFGINNDKLPTTLRYKPMPTLLQMGPQCGIVAVAMCMEGDNKNIEHIFTQAKNTQMTLNGEIFSAENMYQLVKSNVICERVVLYDGILNCQRIVDFLTEGGVMLIPYDKDGNHSPCKKQGHKAHWAAVSGILAFGDEIFVLAKHGKSSHLCIWPLNDLSESNSQLMEFSPARESSDIEYILPPGGIGGPKGLAKKAILIYGLKSHTRHIF